MPQFLILKMGSTHIELRNVQGDFDRWILRNLPEADSSLYQVIQEGDAFPDVPDAYGVIISGSHSMITQPNSWERAAQKWVKSLFFAHVPILGICYGHQMLAHILGGSVGFLPGGPEIGYQRLHFSGNYEKDPLFGIYPSHLEPFTFHYQSVLRLPAGAVSYAKSSRERNHAVRYAEWVWGVQYHPEFLKAHALYYIRNEAPSLERMGMSPEKLLEVAELERPPDILLERFIDVALSKISS